VPAHPTHPDVSLLDGHFYAAEPHACFAWMREHAPVYFDERWGVWGVTRHADVLAASRNPATFCNRHGQRPDSPAIPSMINLDDPDHMRRRKLVNRGFTPRRVADHEPRIRQICRELLDAVAPKGRCDFVRDVAAPLPMIVIGDLLGVAPEDRAMLLRWSDDLVSGVTGTPTPEVAAAAAKAFEEYSRYARQVIADRRRHPGDDLVSVLVHAEIDGERLDDDALVHETLLILVGGDETTRHVISGGMRALIEHPGERAKLVREPGRIPVAVEEMLRWVSPIQNMNRTATRDAELGGDAELGAQKIREGDKLLLLYPSANRDPRAFPDPERFDVERRPNEHVAFGHGPHFCLGASLARLELRVMFEEVLARLPDLERADAGPLPLRPSNFITGLESLPVVFEPREPARG